jgi:hypothetical protein
MLAGYIKLHRKITDWEWYSDINAKVVFFHCLILANFKDSKWRGYSIKRGQFITSYPSLSKDLSLSIQQVRTAIEKLKKTNEIATRATGKNLLVTLVKFDTYQSNEDTEQHDNNTIATGLQQDTNSIATGLQQQRKNDKNIEEEKEEKEEGEKETPPHENDILKTFPMWYLELEQSESFQSLSPKLQTAFKDYLMYRNAKEKRGIVIQTAIQNLKKVIGFLSNFTEDKIIASFELCIEANNVTFDPNFVVNREGSKDKPKEPQGFAYDLPNFQTAKQREWWFFQKFEFYKTLEILENRLINTTYYKLAYEKRQPEKLIQQLETEFPNLLNHPFNNDRWQNIQ